MHQTSAYLFINNSKEAEVAANNVVALSCLVAVSSAHLHLKYTVAKDRILPLNLHICKVFSSVEQYART